MLRLRHILLSVHNLQESIDWYCRNLDFHLMSTMYVSPINCDTALISHGDVVLELACWRGGAADLPEERRYPKTDVQTVGTKQIGLLTDDMPTLLCILRDNHAEIVYTADMGKDEIAMIRDPNGIILEIIAHKSDE